MAPVKAALAIVSLCFGNLRGVIGREHSVEEAQGLENACSIRWAWSGALQATTAKVRARIECDTVLQTDHAKLQVNELHGAERGSWIEADSIGSYNMAAFSLKDLRPETRYSYVIKYLREGKEETEPYIGELRTPGVVGEPLDFSFAFASCADNHSNSVIFDVIRKKDPLFFLHTGDLHYGNIAQNEERLFHQLYNQVMSNPRQRQLFAALALAYMWDDHDFGPNNSHRGSPGREASIRAFLEAVPAYDLPAFASSVDSVEKLPAGELPSIFFSFDIGRVHFVVTDTSSSKEPGQTALGNAQLAWFKQELEKVAIGDQFLIWVSTMPWVTVHSKWAEFHEERSEIVSTIKRLGLASRMVMLSGDAHMLAVDDGENSPGGFPVFQAAALDAKPTCKGGPYSHGIYPGRGQYGWIDVRDDGRNICIAFSGRRVAQDGSEKVLLQFDTCDSTQSSPRQPYYPSPPWVEKLWKWCKKSVLPVLPGGETYIMVYFDSFSMSAAMMWDFVKKTLFLA
mmetsp:Transcript_23068/g.40840  ORF Transcript_23068/g.40840 Transcript_23068/m.40840 type:complete len:511 (-) Transcript_23068:99-1631(-)|eukprot:CAMPEP_0184518234 /NCGR_PEP_ID=MMETSP0198_2-20121128/5980_1 /TAXON_ID=1112570 /ORGANISM="Thraustochytrium sp., Strain LLF1b" /LENGTH=510 /DNA_ID=CAMNT_0026908661 /DNA_START=12 /DNA_END=1544 /DNA_ORIENTATION=+